MSTHKKELLEQSERIMPWGELEALVKPYDFEGKYGNKPYDLERMIRIHLLQNLYDLSDMGARNEVIDIRTFRISVARNQAIRFRTETRSVSSEIC